MDSAGGKKITLGPAKDRVSVAKNGTQLIHRFQTVFLNDRKVGSVEIHLSQAAGGFGASLVVHVISIGVPDEAAS